MDTLKDFREHLKKEMVGNGYTLVIEKSDNTHPFIDFVRDFCKEQCAGSTRMLWHIYYEQDTHPYLQEKICEAILNNCLYAEIKEFHGYSHEDIEMMEMMLKARSARLRFDEEAIKTIRQAIRL